MLEEFANPAVVAFYCAAAVAVGFHLHKGWSKTVLKLELPKDELQRATAIGHAMIFPMCAAFVIVPARMWAIQQPQLAPLLGLAVGEREHPAATPEPQPPFSLYSCSLAGGGWQCGSDCVDLASQRARRPWSMRRVASRSPPHRHCPGFRSYSRHRRPPLRQ